LASGGGPRMRPSPGTAQLIVPGIGGCGWVACGEPSRHATSGERRHREGCGTMRNHRHGRAMSGKADDNRERQLAAITTAATARSVSQLSAQRHHGSATGKGVRYGKTETWLRMMSLSQTTVCGSTRKPSDDASCTSVATPNAACDARPRERCRPLHRLRHRVFIRSPP
jgi:hypothetical protein